MMHGSEWTLKYDEPEVENVTRGCKPSATFSTDGHHMSHEGANRVQHFQPTVIIFHCCMTMHVADWSKSRHVTLSIIECSPLHG